MHAATARQLVAAARYPNEAKARKRLKALEKRGMVRCVGIVNLTGHDEKLWARWNVSKAQHEGELTALILAIRGECHVRRGYQVDTHLADAEIEFADTETKYLEHDRSTMGYAELLQRLKGYDGCGRDVLWSMYTLTRIQGLLSYARKQGYDVPPSVWFATYEQARTDFHGRIWMNAHGETTHV